MPSLLSSSAKKKFIKFKLLDLEESISHIFTLNPDDHESILSIKKEVIMKLLTALLIILPPCYSSGTTGQPKGIMLTHGNIGSNAQVLKDAWGFSNDDILPQLTHLSCTWIVCGSRMCLFIRFKNAMDQVI